MKIKELRRLNNQTQQDIAKHLGIKQETYSAYETKKSEPNIENLIKLADYFNVSLDYLCERPFNNDLGYLNQEQKELAKEISKLDKEQCEQVKAIMVTLNLTNSNKKQSKEYYNNIKSFKGE